MILKKFKNFKFLKIDISNELLLKKNLKKKKLILSFISQLKLVLDIL